MHSSSIALILTCTVLASGLCTAAAWAGDDLPLAKPAEKHAQKRLAKFDANHDGKLDDSERATARLAMVAKLQDRHPALFAKLDTNGDQQLSAEEWKAGRTLRKAAKAERMEKRKNEPVKP